MYVKTNPVCLYCDDQNCTRVLICPIDAGGLSKARNRAYLVVGQVCCSIRLLWASLLFKTLTRGEDTRVLRSIRSSCQVFFGTKIGQLASFSPFIRDMIIQNCEPSQLLEEECLYCSLSHLTKYSCKY